MAMKFSFLETPKELRGKFRGKLHPPSSSTKLQNSQLQNENFPVPPERQKSGSNFWWRNPSQMLKSFSQPFLPCTIALFCAQGQGEENQQPQMEKKDLEAKANTVYTFAAWFSLPYG
ncbi:uncharacterized protein PHA67_007079 isoform 1-T5 [Liasis olivaceus]